MSDTIDADNADNAADDPAADETRAIDAASLAAALAAVPSEPAPSALAPDDFSPAPGPVNDGGVKTIDAIDTVEPDAVDEDEEPDPFPELTTLVEGKRWIELRRELSSMPPPEAADFVSRLSGTERTLVVRFLPRYCAADVFSELPPAIQDEVLTNLTNTEIRNLLSDLDPDDRTALMDEMPASMTRKLLNLLSPQDLKLTRELLGYPDGSVGRIMTPNIVYIKERWTVREALEHIRTFGRDSETVNVVYITDSTGRLIDDITLSKLIMTDPRKEIQEIMDYNFIAISATESQKKAVEMIKKYNYFALPVVDSTGVILGIVTVDDLMDIADTHATEDFQRISAISVMSEDGPIEDLKEASAFLLYKRRIVWLVVLVFVNVFSGAALSFFEDTIAAKTVLVFFLTLLIGSGGNTGSQSATLMVRALATGDVKMKDWGRMLLKEMSVAASLGGVMAGAAAVLGVFRGGRADGFKLATVVAISMFLIVIAGSLIGMSLPFILKKFKKDPAMASSPLVASIADIVGVTIYFSVASVIFGI
ncbi:MAG: magnesium transporter [Chitinispirillales bacterium]|jgi:magnesium transporter|nr:magnesium transporter [Chitinispirillales bacterium]